MVPVLARVDDRWFRMVSALAFATAYSSSASSAEAEAEVEVEANVPPVKSSLSVSPSVKPRLSRLAEERGDIETPVVIVVAGDEVIDTLPVLEFAPLGRTSWCNGVLAGGVAGPDERTRVPGCRLWKMAPIRSACEDLVDMTDGLVESEVGGRAGRAFVAVWRSIGWQFEVFTSGWFTELTNIGFGSVWALSG